uniref:Fibronectin type-III domain-containing protein n=1 Tax=Macrostomum lignano TaxID=282301 RepID=A0A1I8H602_9PLAT
FAGVSSAASVDSLQFAGPAVDESIDNRRTSDNYGGAYGSSDNSNSNSNSNSTVGDRSQIGCGKSHGAGASYCVNCSGKPLECNITASSYTCTGLSSGAEHSVTVVAQAPGHLDSPPSSATGKTLVAPVASVTVTGSNVNCLDVEWPASNTSGVTYNLTCGSNSPIDAGKQLNGSCCGLQSGENLTATVVVVKPGFNNSSPASRVGQTREFSQPMFLSFLPQRRGIV